MGSSKPTLLMAEGGGLGPPWHWKYLGEASASVARKQAADPPTGRIKVVGVSVPPKSAVGEDGARGQPPQGGECREKAA